MTIFGHLRQGVIACEGARPQMPGRDFASKIHFLATFAADMLCWVNTAKALQNVLDGTHGKSLS
jgi:hypothetical protein